MNHSYYSGSKLKGSRFTVKQMKIELSDGIYRFKISCASAVIDGFKKTWEA